MTKDFQWLNYGGKVVYSTSRRTYSFFEKKCGWIVTHIYSRYTLDQSQFKKGFVIMNQISRQNAKTSFRKDFYKLMNNSNFEITTVETRQAIAFCCFFATVFDKIEELSCVKRYQKVFDSEMSEFVSTELLGKEINESFDNKLAALEKSDKFYETKKNSIEIQRKKDLDGVFSMKYSKKKYHQKCNMQN